MRLSVVMLVVTLSAIAVPSVAALSPPQVGIKEIDELPTPLPFPFDRQADANANLDAALSRST